MAIQKLSNAQVRNMDLNQLDLASKKLDKKAPMSKLVARYISLQKEVNFENVDQYAAVGKRFEKKDASKEKTLLKKFSAFLKSIFGIKSPREERLKACKAAEKLCAGYQQLMEANKKEIAKTAKKVESEKAFDDFMKNVEEITFEPHTRKFDYIYNKSTNTLTVRKPIRNLETKQELPADLKAKEILENAFDDFLNNVEEFKLEPHTRKFDLIYNKSTKKLEVRKPIKTLVTKQEIPAELKAKELGEKAMDEFLNNVDVVKPETHTRKTDLIYNKSTNKLEVRKPVKTLETKQDLSAKI